MTLQRHAEPPSRPTGQAGDTRAERVTKRSLLAFPPVAGQVGLALAFFVPAAAPRFQWRWSLASLNLSAYLSVLMVSA